MSQFILERLAPEHSPLVYPLIREAIPGLGLADWKRFVRRTASPRNAAREGVIAARRVNQPYPCGLFCYRRDNDVEHGAVLTADHIIALDILDPRPVLDALLGELDAMAARLGCRAVRSLVHHGGADITEGFVEAGHRVDGASLCKPAITMGAGGRGGPTAQRVGHPSIE